MKLYDETIRRVEDLLGDYPMQSLNVANAAWEDVGDHNLILRSDMAYELGGGTYPAVSAMAVTADTSFVEEDGVYLIGPNLGEITADTPYARIALVRVDADGMGDGNALYNAIRKIEYVRYHINPKGYMTRISASNGREPVRVGKEALSEGLDFAKVGKLFLDKYHENPHIQAVKLIFVTLPEFDYKSLGTLATQCESITGTIDHIFKNVMMDCKSCSLQQVCDEVEGLRELHFASMKEGSR
ncbi:CO dehydrogenase/acetyl-CoA synthase complex beta subunit [Lachnospiraceae bacterium XBD2001]|jgi:hypothetical protein|nr:CO dehydrogenase/acetyl-CoA synthase complex beta subunit [Lachnospiraceae bacterium XBD2001]